MVTRYQYDSLNRLITTTLNYVDGVPSDHETNVQTRVTYDALSRQLEITNPQSQITEYGYDDLGRTVTITDALGHATTTVYDGRGNRRLVTNTENETTEFVYDGVDRLVEVIDNLGNTTAYGYNKAGERITMTDPSTGSGQAPGVETHYSYDDLGRLTGVIENYIDGSYTPGLTDEDVLTEYGYDQIGNRTVITNARGFTTTYVYDDLNRQTEARDALGHTTRYGYDQVGNPTVITDANGDVTIFDYDDVNRLTDIDYSDTTPDVTFTYDQVGNRETMTDGTGTTTYDYDDLYRLSDVTDGAGQHVGYGYDAVGNRTRLIYPDTREVTYAYDDANRLETITDWDSQQFVYTFDDANRLTDFERPNGVTSHLDYDDTGRPIGLTHATATETLASYVYDLDNVGNRVALTETLQVPLNIPQGAYLETNGLVVAEAEHYTDLISTTTHAWLTNTVLSGYEGSAYLHALPDIDLFLQPDALDDSPTAVYPIHFSTPGDYRVWSRAYADNADADAMYVGLDGQVTNVTGFAPEAWDWANQQMPSGEAATLSIETGGVYTLTAAMYEDGLRLDRLLLTTDTTYLPTGAGPAETPRQAEAGGLMTTITRTVVYTYDHLYRLAEADYSTGEYYNYTYDAAGNRVGLNETTLISGTLVTTYTYDAANRLTDREVSDGRVYTYTWSAKGEMLEEWTQGYPVRTFTYNAAGQMIEATVFTLTTVFTYNGDGVRVAMAVDGRGATSYALDYAGNNRILVETTGEGTTQYLYSEAEQECLAEVTDGEWDYYLSDMSGQVRQLADEAGDISSTWLYDPDGMVLEGPEGLVSHLICGGVYDWSTGLIYKGGRYFDPNLGIWLMMVPLAVMSLWHGRRRRGGFSGFSVLLVVVCVSGLVVGCGGGSTPTPIPTPCIKIEPFNSKVYPNLDDTFLFVSPDPDPIPGWNFTYGNQIVWAEDDKEVARDTFEKIRFFQNIRVNPKI